MASRLIINNPGTFNPDEIITMGDFAEYITKALGIYRTGVAKDGLFTDVKKQTSMLMRFKSLRSMELLTDITMGVSALMLAYPGRKLWLCIAGL